MLASCITMQRRTTVAAEEEALATLEAEARRRGVSLSAVLAEAVEEKAAAIRGARRPRTGVGGSTDGRSAAKLTSKPIARPPA
jgi:ribbon-helix-helix CopG family protein